MKASVFIGSSLEGLRFAHAVRDLLNHDAEITVWDEGFFELSKTYIETPINDSHRFDFAIFVLTPDDLVHSRKIETFSPRDNVIFELGLFMGRLGLERTLVLHQASASVKIPSDLAGVTTESYDWPRHDNDERSAVGAACDSIRRSIRENGVVKTVTRAPLAFPGGPRRGFPPAAAGGPGHVIEGQCAVRTRTAHHR